MTLDDLEKELQSIIVKAQVKAPMQYIKYVDEFWHRWIGFKNMTKKELDKHELPL